MEQLSDKGFEPLNLTKEETEAFLLFEDRSSIYYPDVSPEVKRAIRSLVWRKLIQYNKSKGYHLNKKGKRWLKRIINSKQLLEQD